MSKKIDVGYIANLARLRLGEKELEGFSKQLGDIILYIEKLNEADTRGTPPMTHAMPLENVFREDKVEGSLPADKALANAPDRKGPFFKVPRIIEKV